MDRQDSERSVNSFQNGPQLRSIRMGAAVSGSEPSIAFPASMSMESKSFQQEPVDNLPLHTQEWNLPAELPPIPSDYSLGYSHTVVHEATPQRVANRIIEALAHNSIAASPHDSHEVRFHRNAIKPPVPTLLIFSHSPFVFIDPTHIPSTLYFTLY